MAERIPTAGDALRERANLLKHQEDAHRRAAQLEMARADLLVTVRLDMELAADRYDEQAKKEQG